MVLERPFGWWRIALLERNFRLNNQSTLNIMTLDNDKQAWATWGYLINFEDILVFLKGAFGRNYSIALQ
jgi:hypothetical protein